MMGDDAPNAPLAGLLLTADLMFASRVRAAANRLSVEVLVRRADALSADDIGQGLALVMIDLFQDGSPSVGDLVSRLRELAPDAHLVAYGPHVDDAVLQAARIAGCHEVFTRGQFQRQFGDLLSRYLLA